MKILRIWFVFALVVVAGGVVFYFASTSIKDDQAYQGAELDGIAPDFRLINQNGEFVSLSNFRGKAVVLTFMDSQCKDTCPITGAHFRQAYGQLDQNEAKQVVFLGVNVNVEANTVADVLETTRAWHLDEIPGWHFLTGQREELEPVWNDYAVTVEPHTDGSAIMHTPGVFIIDPSGQKRWYVSTVYSGTGDTELSLPLSQLLLNHIREILRDG